VGLKRRAGELTFVHAASVSVVPNTVIILRMQSFKKIINISKYSWLSSVEAFDVIQVSIWNQGCRREGSLRIANGGKRG
jgi:hypothetical protein